MSTLNLFDDLVVAAPKTESIKYAGSKLKLLPHILSLVSKVRPRRVFDAFSGTTRVAQALAQSGYTVIANDISVWSQVFGTCYLLNDHPASHYKPLVDHLNALAPVEGWFTEHYGADAGDGRSIGRDGKKKPWQRHNTERLDAIRIEIDKLNLSSTERAVLLTSLVLAMDEVESTLGHFASYLNDWSPRSYKKMQLTVPRLLMRGAPHEVHQGDVFETAPKVHCDLAYLDPPYGSNNEKMPPSRVRYAAYYHLWTTICLNDRPKLFGRANRRTDTSDGVAGSVFEDFRRNSTGRFVALEAMERAIRAVPAKYVLISYSSGGRATAEELSRVISENGTLLEAQEVDYRRNVMAAMRWTNDWVREAEKPNQEFLFLMAKH